MISLDDLEKVEKRVNCVFEALYGKEIREYIEKENRRRKIESVIVG